MADYTTFTEVDPSSHITVTSASRIDYSGLSRNESAYVYLDKGAAFYSGNFVFDVDIVCTSDTGGAGQIAFAYPWGVCNSVENAKAVITNLGQLLTVELQSTTAPVLVVAEYYNGTRYASPMTTSLSYATTYYLRIRRDEAVGTYGTLYLDLYSDAARTSLTETKSVTLHALVDFRYLYAANTYNDGVAWAQTGYTENLRHTAPINATTAALTLAAYPATVNAGISITASTAALTLATYAADINLDKNITATTAAITLATYSAIVNAATSITASTAALTLTTYPASLAQVFNVDATTAVLTLTTYPAIVNARTSITATTAALTLTTYDAVVTSSSGQATILSVSDFPQGATTECKIVDAVLGLLRDWASTGVNEVQGPTKSAYYITTSVIGVNAGTSGVIYWRTNDLAYEASEAYDFVNIGLTLSTALTGGIAKESTVQSRLAAADFTAPDNAGIASNGAALTAMQGDVDFLLAVLRNKRYLEKVGATWHLVVRNDNDTVDILRKALKGTNGTTEITDIQAAALGMEMKSSV